MANEPKGDQRATSMASERQKTKKKRRPRRATAARSPKAKRQDVAKRVDELIAQLGHLDGQLAGAEH